jgi:hypothetical protein
VSGLDCSREVGATLDRRAELDARLRRALTHHAAEQAMMFTIVTAADRQALRTHSSRDEERRDEWKAEHCQQQDGYRPTQ